MFGMWNISKFSPRYSRMPLFSQSAESRVSTEKSKAKQKQFTKQITADGICPQLLNSLLTFCFFLSLFVFLFCSFFVFVTGVFLKCRSHACCFIRKGGYDVKKNVPEFSNQSICRLLRGHDLSVIFPHFLFVVGTQILTFYESSCFSFYAPSRMINRIMLTNLYNA